jgi:hypothetical protein
MNLQPKRTLSRNIATLSHPIVLTFFFFFDKIGIFSETVLSFLHYNYHFLQN